MPVEYDGVQFETGFRLDFLVEDGVVVEIKAVDASHPVHEAQGLTDLKVSDRRVGLLIDFKVPFLQEGVRRLVR